MMIGHGQMRVLCRVPGVAGEQIAGERTLRRRHLHTRNPLPLACQPVRRCAAQQLHLRIARGSGTVVGEIDDVALMRTLDGSMRRIHKTAQAFGEPVIPARLLALPVHALLHHHPAAIVADDETMQVQIEAVLHGSAVHLGDQAAGLCQSGAVQPDRIAHCQQFGRRGTRMPAAPATDMDAQFAGQWRQPTLERADHAGGNAGRMPVHAHDRTERLKPERVRKPPQQFIAPIAVHDRLAHHCAKPRHPLTQPTRDATSMQGKIRTATTPAHCCRLFFMRSG